MRRKSGAGESRLAKAYPDIAISGTAGARSWNILKAAHVRHEDIDEHQVKAAVFQRTKPGFAAIGYRHVKAVTLEIDLDGRADHGIVIDDENACHVSPWRQIARRGRSRRHR
jgi:hypothetical protein